MDIYGNIEEHNPNKERKILIVFDNMVPGILSNKKLQEIITEIFIRGRKLKIVLVFIIRSYFDEPKNFRLNSTHYFIMEMPSKRDFCK